jgi:hypothetical protein
MNTRRMQKAHDYSVQGFLMSSWHPTAGSGTSRRQ